MQLYISKNLVLQLRALRLPISICGLYSPQMETVWFAAAKRNLSRAMMT
jgi:hypothetical protein